MEVKNGEEGLEPVSPIGQYFSSSELSISILAVLEFEVPVDDLNPISLLKDMFVPIHPRFSSVMVTDRNGVKQWKKIEVNLKDHVNIPIFPAGMSPEYYDKCLDDYISNIAMERLPQSRPLWDIHLIKYPTSNAAANVVFKLHHALGDGYSLMGALLSCLQRADNPSLPLTFPSVHLPTNADGENISIFKSVPKIFPLIINTVSDFLGSISKSILLKDDKTPIRSGDAGVEFRPITVSTMTFSLDHIRQIKTNLGVTINDAITGIIFFGTRLYMQQVNPRSSNAHSTALVLLNTRMFKSYNSVDEMVNPDAKSPWGNHFAFLHASIPKLMDVDFSNPLKFVYEAQKIIKTKKGTLAVYLTAKLLEIMKKIRGPEAAARYLHGTLMNSSMAITNMIGPVEKMSLANHPIRGLYFTVVNTSQSLTISITSYMGKLRIVVAAERGFIDSEKLKSCVENAFEVILKAACEPPSQAN